MKVKPGYKKTDIGVMPEEWSSAPCSELCIKIQDGTHFSPKIRGNDFLYITSKNIRFGYLDIATADRIDAKQHEAIYKRCDVKCGDLLLTKDGANTGNAALNTLTEQFSLLSSVALLRFDEKSHSAAYFLQQFLSNTGQRRMKDAMSGNAITRLTLEKIRKLRLPVAPLSEQRAIAQALSDVDALIAALDRLIAKKRDIKQATMQLLLTGKTRLPGFSGKWKVKQLSEVLTICHGKNQQEVTAVDGPYPILASGGQIGTASRPLYDKPTVLIGRKGTIDRPQYMDSPFWTVDTLFYSAMKNGNLAKFFYYRFWLIDWMRFNEASGVPSLNARTIERIEFACPEPAEQAAIADILSDMDAELTALEARHDKTRALKQGMMQELLTGKTRLI